MSRAACGLTVSPPLSYCRLCAEYRTVGLVSGKIKYKKCDWFLEQLSSACRKKHKHFSYVMSQQTGKIQEVYVHIHATYINHLTL